MKNKTFLSLIALFVLNFSFSKQNNRDLLALAQAQFDSLQSYRVTLKTLCCESDEIIKYSYKKPGFIRMEFINPHEGAILVYNPQTAKVRLEPPGLFGFLTLTLNPDNSLIQNSKGHSVDHSDVGSLLKNVDSLLNKGVIRQLGPEALSGRMCNVAEITGIKKNTVDGIFRYKIWFDQKIKLPLKTEAYDSNLTLSESVLMEDLQIDVIFQEDHFDL